MSDIYELQAGWFKSWQEIQERLMKQYTVPDESWMGFGLSEDWLKSQTGLEDLLNEFRTRVQETVNATWNRNIPTLFFSSFLTNITDQVNRISSTLQGAALQQESVLNETVRGCQDFFIQMFESTSAQSTERLAESFDSWAKEMEKHLSAPKFGITRELTHDLSRLLVLAQDYTRAYVNLSRLVEATGRKAGYRFQDRLRESVLENRPVVKFVDFCALWSVENETVFSEVMGSREFARLQGDFLDTGHRLKIQWNRLAEKALEQTPLALKRDLDLAISEITQLRRDMKTLQRELRETQRETLALREAQNVAKTPAQAGMKKVKTAGSAESAKQVKTGSKKSQGLRQKQG